jgi:hypothetical protein
MVVLGVCHELPPKESIVREFGLSEVFASVPDPRVERTRQHALVDILVIGLLTVLCGGETFEDMEDFGEAKEEWLKERLGLTKKGPGLRLRHVVHNAPRHCHRRQDAKAQL